MLLLSRELIKMVSVVTTLVYLSSSIIMTFLSSVPSATPTSFSANAISPRTINTTWEPPPLYHLGGVITSYTLTYRGMERDTSLKTKILTVLNGSIYITPALTDLEEDTHYEISVRANTSVGAGPWTNLTVHTPEDGELYRSCY